MRAGFLLAAGLLGTIAGSANAQLVSSFGFTELSASFSLDTNEFRAQSSGANELASSGDVTAFGPGGGTALFDPGFFSGGSNAYVVFRMDIVSNNGTTALAEQGRILIVDADGDNLVGSFIGQWVYRSGFAFFDGEITTAQFNDVGDGVFDGPGGGSFDTPEGILLGALSILTVETDGSLFADDFDGRVASADGLLVVPGPGSLALLGAGGLLIGRRRR